MRRLPPGVARVVVGKGNEAQMWIGNWLNASALLDLWPSRQDLDGFMVDGVHQDPKRQRRKPLSWWAWLDCCFPHRQG